jgi:hypothetical protein
MDRHGTHNSHKCDTCGASFRFAYSLQAHLRTHAKRDSNFTLAYVSKQSFSVTASASTVENNQLTSAEERHEIAECLHGLPPTACELCDHDIGTQNKVSKPPAAVEFLSSNSFSDLAEISGSNAMLGSNLVDNFGPHSQALEVVGSDCVLDGCDYDGQDLIMVEEESLLETGGEHCEISLESESDPETIVYMCGYCNKLFSRNAISQHLERHKDKS